ncbi:MAG: T9SS type A sorting domain-containing protein [Bacteroidetes bacterium]|nr:T9SS type A sorting domain-containing protein [Bacteroidota bacterium]
MKQFVFIIFSSLFSYSADCQGTWTWIGGSKYANDGGVYNGASQWPGSRTRSCFVKNDSEMYVFGGAGIGNNGKIGRLNDLWQWNGESWRWLSGSDSAFNLGYFHGNRVPVGRSGGACYFQKTSNELYVFGGTSYQLDEQKDEITHGYRNDLWKWDGYNWTLVNGDSTLSGLPTYQDNNGGKFWPPSISGALYWQDSQNFNLYGGLVFEKDSLHRIFYSNEWWQFDSVGWSLKQGGEKVYDFLPDYPTHKGQFEIKSQPGRRRWSAVATSSSGYPFIYGGVAYDHFGQYLNYRNDLWKWNGQHWGWLAGDSSYNQNASYCKPKCDPGALSGAAAWVDNHDNFWMFGGGRGSKPLHNNMWVWTENKWHLFDGAKPDNSKGIYGKIDEVDPGNWPGARIGAATWCDNNGNLWLFGGYGYDADSNLGYLNDLWKFTPDTNFTIAIKEPKEHQLHVYPNPASTVLRIENNEFGGYVMSMHGQKVMLFNSIQNELNISNLPVGAYFIRFNNGVVKKIVVAR